MDRPFLVRPRALAGTKLTFRMLQRIYRFSAALEKEEPGDPE